MNLFFRKSGAGQPLIILHGLFGISDNWATLAKKLAEQLAIQNALAKLIEPIISLKNTITNSLNFMKQF